MKVQTMNLVLQKKRRKRLRDAEKHAMDDEEEDGQPASKYKGNLITKFWS